MPSTVRDIFGAAQTEPAGVVRWHEPPAPPSPAGATATGIYVVALTDRLDQQSGTMPAASISAERVDELLAVRPELRLDRARPTREQLATRLAAFWFPDEVVLYIGLAGPRSTRPPEAELAKRVSEYYATPLGARSPHAGGWFLKTLANLSDLYVHYGYCDDADEGERAGLRHFAAHRSESSRAALYDPVRVMPFANLEYPKGTRKAHGIKGARAARHAALDKQLRDEAVQLAADPADLEESRRVPAEMDAIAVPWPPD